MKQFPALILALILTLTLAAGCSHVNDIPVFAEAAGPRISIVCTMFPQYDWVRQILGDRAEHFEITLLQDGGADLHSYQPGARDIVIISSADLFIHVGGVSDGWTGGALRGAANSDVIVINLLDILGDTDGHSHACGDACGHEHEYGQNDEHVWLSLRNAVLFCAAITDAIIALDPGNADEYRDNLAAYTEKLAALDAEYRLTVAAAHVTTLLFGDRFPFRRLTDDYGLNYYAAFPGCSADTTASFGTVIFLAGKLDELGLSAVIVTESSDMALAGTIINNTAAGGHRILTLESMQSAIPEGATYLSIMESNLRVLREALG
jgi:zinc transport system substrate-binding protein